MNFMLAMDPKGGPPHVALDETSAARAPASVPMRRCLVTGQVRPKAALLRFVAGPDGSVVADVAGKLPGRGMWLSPRRDVLNTACARNIFAKAAKRPLRADPGLPDEVERLLVRRCIELLGMARRAGAVVGGFEKASARIASGAAGLLLQARDASEDGRRKLRAVAIAKHAAFPIVECLDSGELGQAFGGRALVHVALDRGPLAQRIIDETARLAALRGQSTQAGETS